MGIWCLPPLYLASFLPNDCRVFAILIARLGIHTYIGSLSSMAVVVVVVVVLNKIFVAAKQ